MRYKKGDKVIVRRDLVAGERYGGVYFNDEMQLFCGETLTIRNFDDDIYRVNENTWYWVDAMFDLTCEKFTKEIVFR